MLDIIKMELRITHDKADAVIQGMIDAALADLVRAGASTTVVAETNPLCVRAVATYCKREFTDDMAKHERYGLAYEQMLDELRKSGDGYLSGSDTIMENGTGAG